MPEIAAIQNAENIEQIIEIMLDPKKDIKLCLKCMLSEVGILDICPECLFNEVILNVDKYSQNDEYYQNLPQMN